MAVLLQVVTERVTPPSLQETACLSRTIAKLGMSQNNESTQHSLHKTYIRDPVTERKNCEQKNHTRYYF